ncbi:MAG TPA: hypothetical protein PLI96_07970 [Halothiobacillus sp.]|nr:hypothetical protein [Halothiobacillus sp.]
MGIAAAIGVGTAVAGIAGAVISGNAASSAASKQAAAAQNIANQQQAAGQQAVSLNQQNQATAENYLAPYAAEGQTGINSLNSNLNYLTTPYAPTQAQLAATPGYQFTLQQGLQSTQNSQAAQGLGVSGSALKAASQYATGLANSTYATNAGIYQQNQQQIGNLLTGIIGNGQNAATSQGQLALGFSGNSSNALTGQANASASTQLVGANAQAAGTIGTANAYSSALNGIANSASQAAILHSILSQNSGGSASTGLGNVNKSSGF